MKEFLADRDKATHRRMTCDRLGLKEAIMRPPVSTVFT